MCGIVGAVSHRNIVPVLVQGLQRLEYRGYDSCGVAVHAASLNGLTGGLQRARSTARVAELMEQVSADRIEGGTGIAHTRWATHGAPAVHNAHPHFSHGPGAVGDKPGRVALVHNGIIENHDELRAALQARGYAFASQTDTEVIAHLIDHLYSGDLLDDWRYGGSFIADDAQSGHRREAFNVMLSMPRGTDPLAVQRAARAFAQAELADHKFVMVLHDHQANPHVHISVRAESKHGRRLNPRKTDLHRWRETFAEKLRERGVEAEATRQAARGATRNHPDLWRVKAAEDGRLLKPRSSHRRGAAVKDARFERQDSRGREGQDGMQLPLEKLGGRSGHWTRES